MKRTHYTIAPVVSFVLYAFLNCCRADLLTDVPTNAQINTRGEEDGASSTSGEIFPQADKVRPINRAITNGQIGQDLLKQIEPPSNSMSEHKEILSNPSNNYSSHTFLNDVRDIKWDAIGAFAGITALGFKSWKWGNTDFHFHDEKWFGKDRSSIGMDKLGHAFTSYTMTNLFAEHLQRKGRSPAQSAISAALLTQALMLYVETFDGFSTDHGFAYEDVIMNLAGTSLAYARQRYPKVKDLIDYRMEYSPSGYSSGALGGFRPVSDYAGQKYHLVLKLGGFKALKDTPFKYVELNAGYYARGFTKQEEALNIPRTRTSFVGIGLNLSQLFFGERSQDETLAKIAGRDLFEHIQLPTYTKVYKNKF